MLEIKEFFLDLLKNKKIFLLFIFSFTILLGYLIKNYFYAFDYAGLFNGRVPMSNSETNYNFVIFIISYLIYLLMLFIFSSEDSSCKINKKIFSILNLLILISGLIFVLFTDGDSYRINLMKVKYAKIIVYDPSYVKNKNSIDLLKAIENNKPKDFIKILENPDDNMEQNTNSIIKLFEIVNEFFPEKKSMLLSALKDDYFTKQEFKNIKLSILKDIDKKELNTAQIAMIGDLK